MISPHTSFDLLPMRLRTSGLDGYGAVLRRTSAMCAERGRQTRGRGGGRRGPRAERRVSGRGRDFSGRPEGCGPDSGRPGGFGWEQEVEPLRVLPVRQEGEKAKAQTRTDRRGRALALPAAGRRGAIVLQPARQRGKGEGDGAVRWSSQPCYEKKIRPMASFTVG